MEILKKKNKLIEKKYSVNYKYVDISVSLERGREDGEGDTFFFSRTFVSHHLRNSISAH